MLATQGGSSSSSGGASGGGAQAPGAPQPLQASLLSQAQGESGGGEEVVVRISEPGVQLLVAAPALAPGVVAPALTGVPSVTVGGAPALEVSVLDAQTLRFRVPPNPRGNRTVELEIQVRVGNYLSSNLVYRYRSAPITIAAQTSISVPASGGSFVVSGAGFVDDLRAEINGASAPLRYRSATQVEVTAPPAPAGSALDLRLLHPEGSSALLSGGVRYYTPTPSLPSGPIGRQPTILILSSMPLGNVEIGTFVPISFALAGGAPPSALEFELTQLPSGVARTIDVEVVFGSGSYSVPPAFGPLATEGGEYRFRLYDPNFRDLTFYSGSFLAVPKTPPQPTLVSAGATTISIGGYAATGDGAVRYDIFRGREFGPLSKVATTSAAQFDDAGLDPGTRYQYRVVGGGTHGNSGFSPTLETQTGP